MSSSDWTDEEEEEEDEQVKRKAFLANMKANVDKQDFSAVPCKKCGKPVQHADQLKVDGHVFHKSCFRCEKCNGMLKMGTFAALDGTFYCNRNPA